MSDRKVRWYRCNQLLARARVGLTQAKFDELAATIEAMQHDIDALVAAMPYLRRIWSGVTLGPPVDAEQPRHEPLR